MDRIKHFLGGLLLCIIEVAVGILLLIEPVRFTSGIIIACGGAMLLWSLVCVIRYFRMEATAAAESKLLTKGLILLLVGGFCILKSQWFLSAIPMLTILYGTVILVSGLWKIQWTVDLLRTRKVRWFLAAISAVISLVCAVIILSDPFPSTDLLWIFTGVSLVCEAFLDIITFLLSGKKAPEPEITEPAAEILAETPEEVPEAESTEIAEI